MSSTPRRTSAEIDKAMGAFVRALGDRMTPEKKERLRTMSDEDLDDAHAQACRFAGPRAQTLLGSEMRRREKKGGAFWVAHRAKMEALWRTNPANLGGPGENPAPSDSDIADRRSQRGRRLGNAGSIAIYRACPADTVEFFPMDYVTNSLKFARGHAEHQAAVTEEPQHVISARVPYSDVYEAPNAGELFCDGPRVRGRVVAAGPRTNPVRGVGTDDPMTMSGARLRTERERLRVLLSGLNERFIAAGRGHETGNETRSKIREGHGDPLSLQWLEVENREADIRNELSERKRLTGSTERPRARAVRENPTRSTTDVVRVFNDLIAKAPDGAFPHPVALVVDDATALAGRAPDGRGHACATADTVYIARKLLRPVDSHGMGLAPHAARNRQVGVLAHELAHVSLLQRGDTDHTERDADAMAEDLFGVRVNYDAEDVQTTGPGAHPRPAHLDATENPARTKHSPQIRLTNARRRWKMSCEECPHWDEESDGEAGQECCYNLADARTELGLARRAFLKAEKGRV